MERNEVRAAFEGTSSGLAETVQQGRPGNRNRNPGGSKRGAPARPARAEDQHFEIIGDTGSGKTTIIMQMLRQIQARKHSAIIYDPACEFIEQFYRRKPWRYCAQSA